MRDDRGLLNEVSGPTYNGVKNTDYYSSVGMRAFKDLEQRNVELPERQRLLTKQGFEDVWSNNRDFDLTKDSVDSMVSRMASQTYSVRISHAVNDLVRPLTRRIEEFHLADRIENIKNLRESTWYWTTMIEQLEKLNTRMVSTVLRGLKMEYSRFMRNPVWTTLRLTLIPTTRFLGRLAFGFGDKRSGDQKIVDAIERQTEFQRTGQISQNKGLFKEIIQEGVLPTALKGVTQGVAGLIGADKNRAQELEDKRAKGIETQLSLTDKLAQRLHNDRVTLKNDAMRPADVAQLKELEKIRKLTFLQFDLMVFGGKNTLKHADKVKEFLEELNETNKSLLTETKKENKDKDSRNRLLLAGAVLTGFAFLSPKFRSLIIEGFKKGYEFVKKDLKRMFGVVKVIGALTAVNGILAALNKIRDLLSSRLPKPVGVPKNRGSSFERIRDAAGRAYNSRFGMIARRSAAPLTIGTGVYQMGSANLEDTRRQIDLMERMRNPNISENNRQSMMGQLDPRFQHIMRQEAARNTRMIQPNRSNAHEVRVRQEQEFRSNPSMRSQSLSAHEIRVQQEIERREAEPVIKEAPWLNIPETIENEFGNINQRFLELLQTLNTTNKMLEKNTGNGINSPQVVPSPLRPDGVVLNNVTGG